MDIAKFFGVDPRRVVAIPLAPRQGDGLFVPDESYFQVKLVQMSLRAAHRFAAERYPVVHAITEFGAIGGKRKVASVVSPEVPGQPNAGNLGNVIVRDQQLTEDIVFRGGAINLSLGLYSAPGDDWAQQFFTLAKSITQAVGGGAVSSAIAVAEPIKAAFDSLLSRNKMTLEIGLKLDLHRPELKAHRYFALIALDNRSLNETEISFDGSSVTHAGSPITDTDLIVLETTFSSQRRDLMTLEIASVGQELVKEIGELIISASSDAENQIKLKYQSFVARAFASDVLNRMDRTRLIVALRERVSELRASFADWPASSRSPESSRTLIDDAAKENPRLFDLDLGSSPTQPAALSLHDALELHG